MSGSKKVKNFFIILGITAACFYAVDFTFGLMLPDPSRPYDTHRERLDHPAYAQEPYFSEEFLSESFVQPEGWLTPENSILVFPLEYHGKYFNVDTFNNITYRRTVNPAPRTKDSMIILMLGGSTLYESEVPDRLTVPSILSEKLNNSHPSFSAFILNAGVSSANSTQELARLKFELESGTKPDFVITYNGVNDVTQGIYFDDPAGVMFSGDKRPKLNKYIKKMKGLLPRRIYKYFTRKQIVEGQRTTPEHMLDGLHVAKRAEETADIYRKNLEEMRKLAVQHGFKLLVVLQPTIFSGNFVNQTEDISFVLSLSEHKVPAMDKAFRAGYPLLRRVIDELGDSVNSYDASEIFNEKEENIYIDFCHVNSLGNQIIAQKIYTELMALLTQ